MTNIRERFDEDVAMARVYMHEGSFGMAAARLRDLAQTITNHAVEVETRRDYPEEFKTAPGDYDPAKLVKMSPAEIEREKARQLKPAAGKVMHAPPGTVPHPTAHLTDKQREALALSEQKAAERIKREALAKIDRLGRKGERKR